ncbi:MAG: hypothetical protein ACKOD2_06910, partial [Ilumatobacteraceae bacterium]
IDRSRSSSRVRWGSVLRRAVIAALLVGSVVVAGTTPSASAAPFTWTEVHTGHAGACARTNDARWFCWGMLYDGQHRYGPPTWRYVPVPREVVLPGGRAIADLSLGHYDTSCAVDTDGQAWCGGIGQLGAQYIVESVTPVPVEAPAGVLFESVEASWSISCGLSTYDELWCWGDVLDTGSGETEAIRTPVKVALPSGVTVRHYSIGIDTYCIGGSDGNSYCWGSNDDGEGGTGDVSRARFVTPTRVSTPAGVEFARFEIGLNRVCALSTNGDAYCWGDNYGGSFGDDTYNDSRLPRRVLVPGNESVIDIASGWYHTCIVTVTNASYCFGNAGQGELGTGTTLGGYTKRAPRLPNGVKLRDIAATNSRTVAIDTTGRIWLWGKADGSTLGLSDRRETLDPLPLVPIGTPDVGNVAVSDVDAHEFTVEADVTANADAANAQIQWSTDPTFSRVDAINAAVGGGFGTVTRLVRRVTNLEPRTTYHVRVVASNAFSGNTPTVSPSVSVTTLGDPPVVSVPSVHDITGEGLSASASVHPGRLATGAILEVLDPASRAVVATSPVVQTSGRETQKLDFAVAGLSPATDYLVRVSATNRLGTVVSPEVAVRTIGAPPTVGNVSATPGLDSVVVSADVGTGALATEAWVAVASASGPRTSGRVLLPAGGDSRISLTVDGLSPHTDHVALVRVSNRVGAGTPAVVYFRTLGKAPVVAAPRAVDVGREAATLEVDVDTSGLLTFGVLQVSSDPTFVTKVSESFVLYGTVLPPNGRRVAVINLRPDTDYFARVVATNSAGTSTSEVVSWHTQRPIGVVIDDGADSTSLVDVTLGLTAPAGAVAVAVSNRSDMSEARFSLVAPTIAWQLEPSTEPEAERWVFVRYYGADGSVSQVYSDSIRLLAVPVIAPPIVAQSISEAIPVVPAANAKAKVSVSTKTLATSVRFTVRTRASRSSIVGFQVRIGGTITTHHMASSTDGVYRIPIPAIRPRMQIRLFDSAGLVSKWVTVKAKKK